MGIFSLNPITGRLDEIGNGGGGGGGNAIISIAKQVFTNLGENVYVPTPGMSYCIGLFQAPGGGGGGAAADDTSVGGGGGGGGFFAALYTAADIGESQPIFIGAPGTRGPVGGPGGNGGFILFGPSGALGSASGGMGGATGVFANGIVKGGDGAAGSSPKQIFDVPGSPGGFGMHFNSNATGGLGGGSFLGAQSPVTRVVVSDLPSPGRNNSTGYGAGGSGGASMTSPSGALGGIGGNPIVIFIEYLIAV